MNRGYVNTVLFRRETEKKIRQFAETIVCLEEFMTKLSGNYCMLNKWFRLQFFFFQLPSNLNYLIIKGLT